MTSTTFGLHTDSMDHPLVSRALELSREFMNVTGPVSNLTDFVPLLQHNLNPLQRRAQRLHRGLVETYVGIIKEIDEEVDGGMAVDDCLAKTMLEAREMENLDDLDMAILASAFMIGGVETVRVDRLERCHNPYWLGTPHLASEDLTYQGKFIPKDTVVVLNTWTMRHDSSRYFDPSTFNPNRYINDHLTSAESANLVDPYERDHSMFGAGRRICPGMLVAEREIWLAISRMFWAFDMAELPGEPIDLKEYDGLSGRSPVPFKIVITPRYAKVEDVPGAVGV